MKYCNKCGFACKCDNYGMYLQSNGWLGKYGFTKFIDKDTLFFTFEEAKIRRMRSPFFEIVKVR